MSNFDFDSVMRLHLLQDAPYMLDPEQVAAGSTHLCIVCRFLTDAADVESELADANEAIGLVRAALAKAGIQAAFVDDAARMAASTILGRGDSAIANHIKGMNPDEWVTHIRSELSLMDVLDPSGDTRRRALQPKARSANESSD